MLDLARATDSMVLNVSFRRLTYGDHLAHSPANIYKIAYKNDNKPSYLASVCNQPRAGLDAI